MRSCRSRAGGNIDLAADAYRPGVIGAVRRRENVAADQRSRRSTSASSATTTPCFQRGLHALHAPDTAPNCASCRNWKLGAFQRLQRILILQLRRHQRQERIDTEAFDLSSAELGGSLRLRGPVLDRISR